MSIPLGKARFFGNRGISPTNFCGAPTGGLITIAIPPPWLHLEKANAAGVFYRQVLSQVAHEVERLLRLGMDFDIAIDDPLFKPEGYHELIYALEDGRLRIEQAGEPTRWLDQPRPSNRPDLGPGPRLWLERVEAEGDSPGEIRFRAVGRLSTGDWAGEQPHARVSWEVYGPDDLVSPAVFPEYGSGIHANVDAMARIGYLYLRAGRWVAVQIIPSARPLLDARAHRYAQSLAFRAHRARPGDPNIIVVFVGCGSVRFCTPLWCLLRQYPHGV